jgi:hypothetical protein
MPESATVQFRPKPRDIYEVNALGFAHKQWAGITLLVTNLALDLFLLPYDPLGIRHEFHGSPQFVVGVAFLLMFVTFAAVILAVSTVIIFTLPYSWMRATVTVDESGLTIRSLGTMMKTWKQVRWIDLTPRLIYFGGNLYDFAVPRRAFASDEEAVGFYYLCKRWQADALDDAPPEIPGEWPPRPERR